MTFAKAQIRLQITQLTVWTTLSIVGVWFDAPARLVRNGSLLEDWLSVVLFLGCYVVVSLPFDWLGGFKLWRSFGRKPPLAYITYLQSTLLHALSYSLIAGLLLLAGRANCLTGVLATAVGVMMGQVQFQGKIASLIGRMRKTDRHLGAETRLLRRRNLAIDNVLILESADPAFGGGFSGRNGHAQLVLPSYWLDEVGSEYTAHQIVRRAGALKDNSRSRGLMVAMAFNISGLAISSLLPSAGFGSASELITTMLAFTLWSALGQISILPWFTRQGAFECDYYLAKKGVPKRKVTQVMEQTQTLIEAPGSAIYPTPAATLRLMQVAGYKQPRGAWHVQQMATYLSWGCLGLLSRAAWNSGRPQLWVMGVTD